MPRKLTIKLSELWLALTAASARSSEHWIAGKAAGPLVVYSPSLGPMRQIVEIAETYVVEFTAYIALMNPGTVRRLLNIVQAAHKVVAVHREPPCITTEEFEARIEKMKAAIKELAVTLEDVEVPQ